MIRNDLCVCIPTYRRPRYLRLLLDDIAAQSLWPAELVISDGEPSSGEVAACIANVASRTAGRLVHLASSYASLPYQRYIGWRAAAGTRYLLYIDDDIRITDRDFIAKLLRALDDGAAGVTCPIEFSVPRSGLPVSQELTKRGPRRWHRLFNLGRTPKGGVSPAGHRRMPVDRGHSYEPVEWLSGGVMALSRSAVTEECFPDIGFALFLARLGTGEDLVLARHVRQAGPLTMAYCTAAQHPGEAPSNFGPQSYFPLGVTMAYGERYVNDHYRGGHPPTAADRLFLLRSLTGTLLLSCGRTLRCLCRAHLLYTFGFARGMFRALFAFPAAAQLAPGAAWARDAEKDLRSARRYEHAARS